MAYLSSLRGIQLVATTQLVMSQLEPQLFESYGYVSFINLAIKLLPFCPLVLKTRSFISTDGAFEHCCLLTRLMFDVAGMNRTA
jgi:hypothetical protein